MVTCLPHTQQCFKMIIYFFLLFFEPSLSKLPSNNLPTIPKSPILHDNKLVWGVLHSLDQYTTWAIRDSQIFQLLQTKKENLKLFRHLTKIYLQNLKKNKRNNLSIISQLTNKLASLNTKIVSSSEFLNLLEIKSQQISSNDLFLSMNGLLQPHQYNDLYPHEIAKGLDIDILPSHGGHLTVPQCLEIGLFSLYRKWYTRSVEWLHVFHNFAINSEIQSNHHLPNKPFIVDLASALFSLVIQEHNRILVQPETLTNYFISINLYSRSLKKRSNPPKTKLNRTFQQVAISYPRKTFDHLPSDNPDMQYATLCKDINYKVYTPYRFNLKCFYEKWIHAYFYINPVKTEHLSKSPPVYLYYDVMNKRTNDELRLMNDGKVEMNRTSNVSRKSFEFRTEMKTSTWSAVEKGETRNYGRLEWISEQLTGLKISMEETENKSMEYTPYTYGRMVGAHTDVEYNKVTRYSQWELLRKDGERLATLLYYLQPAYLGGQTAFCQGGFNAVPSKNSLLVYYHLYRNGSVRQDIDHGSCPVLHGTKIVLLAATRYLPNWKSFKCSLNKNE